MNSYGKDYDAFDIFEEIMEEEENAGGLIPAECVSGNSSAEAGCISEKIPPRMTDEEKTVEVKSRNMSNFGCLSENELDFGAEMGRSMPKAEGRNISSAKARGKNIADLGIEGRNIPGLRAEARNRSSSKECGMYYEIEYDACPLPGVGKFVLKPQKVEAPPRDEIRELFDRMREIARTRRSYALYNSKFYDKRVQAENSRIFYEQGMFMKDFEDYYTKAVAYSAYFPYYQMMGYEQLRTYFSWRTEVRKGFVEKTSLSYAYLYLYELLSNIGVESPEEGLEKLMFFWKEYREYDASIDKYVRHWLKDYHIYYELPHTFQEFIERNDLVMYYPKQTEPKDNFELFCAISKYDIRKSKFYTEDRVALIKDCFAYTMEQVKKVFEENAICFDEAIFQPVKNMTVWTPFKDALFYPWKEQRDRRVVFSEKEVYVCDRNCWTFQTTLTTENGKRLLGFIMKQMEVVLRGLTKYKYPLTADIGMVNDVVLARLKFLNISLEQVISQAVQEFYRETTKVVVKVDMASLTKIRQEALQTQEKLIVPEELGIAGGRVPIGETLSGMIVEKDKATGMIAEEDKAVGIIMERAGKFAGMTSRVKNETCGEFCSEQEEQEKALQKSEGNKFLIDEKSLKPANIQSEHLEQGKQTENDEWTGLRSVLTDVEIKALRLLLNGEGSLKPYADAHNVMLEVLMDGINEKAMDVVGDSLLEDEFTIYEDYIEQVKGMVEGK